MRSSTVKSCAESVISVRRSSPKSATSSSSSSRITARSRSGSPRMSSRSAISATLSAYSCSSFSCSSPVKRFNRRSRMACACAGDKWYLPSMSPKSPSRSSGRQAASPARSSMALTSPGAHAAATSRSRASAAVGEVLMSSMISSMLASATARPSKT